MEPTDLSGFCISTQTAPAGNPNTEIRNPKQIQNPNGHIDLKSQ
jgi:hypothetical protein